MNHGHCTPLAGLALLLAASAAPGQDDRRALSAAWLAEHLRREPDELREVYERVVLDEAQGSEARAVAAARLVEIDRMLGDAAALDRHLGELKELLDSLSGFLVPILALPRAELHDALAMTPGPDRDRALAAARRALTTELDAQRAPPRSTVPLVVRRLAADHDAQRERLERELVAAAARGDEQRVRALRDQLRPSRGARSLGVDRHRAWRVRAVRSLTEGRFDLAEKILARLPAVVAAPENTAEDRLRIALERDDLDRAERVALEALARRITEWRAAEAPDADRALALLPY